MHFQERQLLHRAIQFATAAHQGQKRKGSGLDYICHPMEVLQILTQCNASLPVLIAGVLHDTIEDTPVTAQQIHDAFGPQVTALVLHHSEDKGQSWKARKTAAIHQAQAGTLDCKLLIAADKVSNLRSTADDYQKMGDALWQLFRAGRDEISWYYRVHAGGPAGAAASPPQRRTVRRDGTALSAGLWPGAGSRHKRITTLKTGRQNSGST